MAAMGISIAEADWLDLASHRRSAWAAISAGVAKSAVAR
jgi:hypothetical protein